jgi:hypothetical protein
LIENGSIDSFKHREQRNMPEWQGADVQITSDFEKTPQDWSSEHDLWVRTHHATHLTWLFFELKHVFSEYLSYRNKYGFYEALGQSALKYLSTNQPESECPRALLKAVLSEAFGWLEYLKKNGELPDQSPVIIHQIDEEGRQRRIGPEDIEL